MLSVFTLSLVWADHVLLRVHGLKSYLVYAKTRICKSVSFKYLCHFVSWAEPVKNEESRKKFNPFDFSVNICKNGLSLNLE